MLNIFFLLPIDQHNSDYRLSSLFFETEVVLFYPMNENELEEIYFVVRKSKKLWSLAKVFDLVTDSITGSENEIMPVPNIFF